MSNLEELKSVVKDTLDKRGVLDQVKARIRAEVFNALDDDTEPRPALSNENFLINELIREYLEFNKYKYTSSVLLAESGQPKTPLDRDYITNELNITDDPRSSSVPLLYNIISFFMKKKGLPMQSRQVDPSHYQRQSRFNPQHKPGHPQQSREYDEVHEGEAFVVQGGSR